MKLELSSNKYENEEPAAFRRLCVETWPFLMRVSLASPAAFGRLCVETISISASKGKGIQPPSGGCVLKQVMDNDYAGSEVSRLQAAVC